MRTLQRWAATAVDMLSVTLYTEQTFAAQVQTAVAREAGTGARCLDLELERGSCYLRAAFEGYELQLWQVC